MIIQNVTNLLKKGLHEEKFLQPLHFSENTVQISQALVWPHRVHTGFLVEFSFTPLLYHPGGCLGCPEKRTSSRNYNLFVWSAVFQPKWNDIKKTYKNYQNPVKSYCFLGYYQSLFNFGWKTAAQTNQMNLSGSYQ